ncbi:hypothetical protein [Planctomicrobium sp. SH664]|uniref:hypothetical protein n=1 Tax=Planctomicrobium sp. SH664 TaxID=3448125 RepID=UPI003F5C6D45
MNGSETPPSPKLFRWFSALAILTTLSMVTARLIDAPPLQSANDRSRWSTVWSLVERNTYQIDEIRQHRGWASIDMVQHEGHFYSSKPPLLPRLVAELYRGIKQFTGWNLLEQTHEITCLILFLVNIVPMGLALWSFARLVERRCSDLSGQIFLVTAACYATLLLPFLLVFNNHTIAASAFFLALPLAIDLLSGERTEEWRFALCGFLTAFGVCNEFPAAAFGTGLFLLLLWSSPRRALTGFLPGALIPLIAFFLTTYEATGGFKPFYMYYGTDKYNFIHEGVPSYWMEPRGVDRARDSFGTYLLHCTLGHHGIWSLSPIYLLSLLTWCWPRWWGRSESLTGSPAPTVSRDLTWIVYPATAAMTLLVLGFYLTKTENYNYGGVSVALRWTLWLIPFWLLSMIPVLNAWGRSAWFRWLCGALLSVSVFSAWYPENAPWTQPWLFRWMTQQGWIDYSDPPEKFQPARFSWIGSIPDGEFNPAQPATAEYLAYDLPEMQDRLRLIDGGGDDLQRIIRIERTDAGGAKFTTGYRIDVPKFRAGLPPKEFLIGRDDGAPLTISDFELLAGGGEDRPYVSSGIRYIKTRLRRDAFKCHIGYAWRHIETPEGPQRLYRTVWFCDELPFGILKFEDRVSDRETNAILMRRQWELTRLP